jgi:hypothetical protein
MHKFGCGIEVKETSQQTDVTTGYDDKIGVQRVCYLQNFVTWITYPELGSAIRVIAAGTLA